MVDELRITVKAGRGGDGRVSFFKGRGQKGPSGGDGGNGGSVYMEAVSDLSVLRNYRYKKTFEAEDGHEGGTKLLKGKNGEDLIIKVPIGTIAHNLDTKEDFEVLEAGQRVRLAKGGKGGRGNWQFRTAVRQAPEFAESGRSEESFEYYIELKLIADAGFIGLPSAGKSSLLNALTNATSKVASYHFTTLEANLGVFYAEENAYKPVILADIPGLIEGAHQGKGLGDKFLRHIQRTKFLFHCIGADSEDMEKDYNVIRSELSDFNTELTEKNECIVLTKTDLLSEQECKERVAQIKKLNPNVITSSIETKGGIEQVKDYIADKIAAPR